VEWLWPDRIPLGAITVLDGDPGQSKSTLTYDLAARVTAGIPMPFCDDVVEPAGVVLIQAEDSLGGKVKPTLIAAGADIERVRVFDRKLFQVDPLVLPDDVPLIKSAAAEVQARLVVIDPLTSFLGGNVNSDQSVRRAMGPLAALAEEAGLAVLIARHLTKRASGNPLYRGAGSIGIIALARSALWVTSDPSTEDPYQHLLVQTKTNLSTAVSLSYRTKKQDNGIIIEWLGESKSTAMDIIGSNPEDLPSLVEAQEVLETILKKGPLPARAVFGMAADAGISKRTLDRAKRILKVKSKKEGSGYSSKWSWQLPEEEKAPLAVLSPSAGVNV